MRRQGRAFGMTAREAVTQLCGVYSAARGRKFRQVVMALRDRGWPICSTADAGYYWPSSQEELKAALNWQRSRAIATLRQIGRQQRWGAKALAGQGVIEGTGPVLTMPFDSAQGRPEPTPPYGHPSQEGRPSPPAPLPKLGEGGRTDGFAVLAAEIPRELWEAAEAWMADKPGWTRDRVAAAAMSLFLMQKPGCDPVVTRVYLDTLELD